MSQDNAMSNTASSKESGLDKELVELSEEINNNSEIEDSIKNESSSFDSQNSLLDSTESVKNTVIKITTKREEKEQSTSSEEPTDFQGVSLGWCLGINCNSLNNVQNLTSEDSSLIFYTSGNTGVLFDYDSKTQTLFQGHTDMISSVQFNAKKDIIVTADSGKSCLMVVWDAYKGIPLKTIFSPHANGVAVIDISPCGKYVDF